MVLSYNTFNTYYIKCCGYLDQQCIRCLTLNETAEKHAEYIGNIVNMENTKQMNKPNQPPVNTITKKDTEKMVSIDIQTTTNARTICTGSGSGKSELMSNIDVPGMVKLQTESFVSRNELESPSPGSTSQVQTKLNWAVNEMVNVSVDYEMNNGDVQ